MVPPVAGRRVLSFGERTSYGPPSRGAAIESTPGAPVSAPAAGFVLFAGEWRSYGPLIILDGGCGAEVLLSGVAALTIAAGDHVDRGGPIGKVAAPMPGGRPTVYFEVRRNGAPVDPER
jgi:septal ring factor EnvC (AmiA/AmiB activator)